jgi:hypothetical protein
VRQLAAVGKFSRLQLGVELHHAGQRRPRELLHRVAREPSILTQAWFGNGWT